MKKLKVIDFDYGCGGFSKGLEDSGLFEVVYNGFLNEKNFLCYNKVHKNKFSYEDVFQKDVDLAIFTPNLGQKLYGKGEGNFIKSELNNCLAFILLHDFDNLIFITQREAVPYLHFSDKVFLTSDGKPTKDIICCRLLDLGYNVYNFVLDGAGFGLPQHKYYNIYWASKNIDSNILIKEGFGIYKRPYRLVRHLISDIDDDSDLSWHNPDYRRRDVCCCISPGSNAYKTSSVSQSVGYIRCDGDKFSPSLTYNFYLTSSKGPSVHPWFDRPFTIREGARLFGLSDDFDWDVNLKKKDVAMMIYESFSPIVSKLMSNKISKLIRNE